MLSNPAIYRNKECMVTIRCQTPDPVIHYTLDGSEPNAGSPIYERPFELPDGGVVKAIAMIDRGTQKSEVIENRFDICPANWTIEAVSAQHSSYPAENAIDGNPSTMWHTPWGDDAPGHPHTIIIDFGENLALKGFSYLPRTDGQLGGVCKSYKVEVSEDGTTWKPAKQGAFDNIRNSPFLQEIRFGKTINARYLRFTSLSNVNGSETLSAAEFGVITLNK
jgi:alpha-L-fucosidase